MFNYGGKSGPFYAKRVIGGIYPGETESYRTLFAGMSYIVNF